MSVTNLKNKTKQNPTKIISFPGWKQKFNPFPFSKIVLKLWRMGRVNLSFTLRKEDFTGQ